MLNVKMSYIRGLILATAIFGLTDCTKKSKKDAPVVNEENQGGSNGGNGSNGGAADITGGASNYIDPTENTGGGNINVQQEFDYSELPTGRKPVFTDLAYNSDLFYTDNNIDRQNKSDTLVEQAKRSLEDQIDEDDLKAHKEFAKSLIVTQVIVDPQDPNDITLNFKTLKNKTYTSQSLSGKVREITNKNGESFLIARLNSGNNSSGLVVNAQCMDLNNTCHHIVLRFMQNSQKQKPLIAFAVFRSTPVNISYFSPMISFDQQQQNFELFTGNESGFFKFYQMLNNSSRNNNNFSGIGRVPRIQSMILQSSAVVYGKSQFALFARILHRQQKETLLPIFGPLVRNDQDNDVNLSLNKFRKNIVLKDASSEVDPILKQIKNITLLQNTGRGSLQLLIDFGADQQQSGDIVLTISRTAVQLRALSN